MEDSAFEGMGCYGVGNKAALYQKITESHQTAEFPGHYGSLFPIEQVQVSFSLRNGRDPVFLAKRLSDNSFDFGLSARDFFVIGILGMVSSLIAMFRPCVVMCSVCRRHDYSKDFKDTVI